MPPANILSIYPYYLSFHKSLKTCENRSRSSPKAVSIHDPHRPMITPNLHPSTMEPHWPHYTQKYPYPCYPSARGGNLRSRSRTLYPKIPISVLSFRMMRQPSVQIQDSKMFILYPYLPYPLTIVQKIPSSRTTQSCIKIVPRLLIVIIKVWK